MRKLFKFYNFEVSFYNFLIFESLIIIEFLPIFPNFRFLDIFEHLGKFFFEIVIRCLLLEFSLFSGVKLIQSCYRISRNWVLGMKSRVSLRHISILCFKKFKRSQGKFCKLVESVTGFREDMFRDWWAFLVFVLGFFGLLTAYFQEYFWEWCVLIFDWFLKNELKFWDSLSYSVWGISFPNF